MTTRVSIEIGDRTYQINSAAPINIAIPLRFNDRQPAAFGVLPAAATACETGAFVGDTRRGGSCNFDEIRLVPHCNGTHTESVGHIARERIAIHDCLRDAFIPATLISVEAVGAAETIENYPVELNADDSLITRRALENALENADENLLRGLIVRTLPNDESKLTRNYSETAAPFFSSDAMRFIVEKNVKHLLVDMPSIDRAFDEGKLSNHRIFWRVEPGSFELTAASAVENTITEMIFAPEAIADGAYLLNLQIAAFALDASPSRPILFRVF